MRTVLDMPLMQGLNQMVNNYAAVQGGRKDLGMAAAETVFQPGQFVPTLLGQWNAIL